MSKTTENKEMCGGDDNDDDAPLRTTTMKDEQLESDSQEFAVGVQLSSSGGGGGGGSGDDETLTAITKAIGDATESSIDDVCDELKEDFTAQNSTNAKEQELEPVVSETDTERNAELVAIEDFIKRQPASFQRAIKPLRDMVEIKDDLVDPIVHDAIRWAMQETKKTLSTKSAHSSIIGDETRETLIFVPVCNMNSVRSELEALRATELEESKSLNQTEPSRTELQNELDELAMNVDYQAPFTMSVALNAPDDVTNSCSKQRQTLTFIYSGKSSGNESRISLPISPETLSNARGNIHEFACGQFFRMPLLVMGCHQPFFSAMITGEKTPYATDTLNCVREAVAAIAAMPHAYGKQTNDKVSPGLYRSYMEKLDNDLRDFEQHWCTVFRDTFTSSDHENTEESTDVADVIINTFSRMAPTFFRFLASMTMSYVRLHWAFAMDSYGYSNQHETHRFLGMNNGWGMQIDNYSPEERSFMISTQDKLNAWRKEERTNQRELRETESCAAFLVALDEDVIDIVEVHIPDTFTLGQDKAADEISSESHLMDVFKDTYHVDAKATTATTATTATAASSLNAKDENPNQIVTHLTNVCHCANISNIYAYPEDFTIGDLFRYFISFHETSLWGERKKYADIFTVEPDNAAAPNISKKEDIAARANGKEEEAK